MESLKVHQIIDDVMTLAHSYPFIYLERRNDFPHTIRVFIVTSGLAVLSLVPTTATTIAVTL